MGRVCGLTEFKHSYYKITGIVEKILEDKE